MPSSPPFGPLLHTQEYNTYHVGDGRTVFETWFSMPKTHVHDNDD